MRLFVSVLLLVLSAKAAVITGTVRDPDGYPVAGATVRIDGGIECRTGDDGAYRLDLDGIGERKVTAEFDGFLAVQKAIDIAGDVNLDLTFMRLAALTQSVSVTAASSPDPLNPDPARRVFVREEMLDANPGRPGAPVSIPGLPVESASGGIKAPQYFAPGVPGDHGEPISQYFQVGSYLLPNNLSANAHGNGYADPNVIIPAAIESVQTDGGAFNVLEGNHSVDLSVKYGLRSRLEPFVAVAGDGHDVDVAVGWSPAGPATRAWIAIEAAYGDGFLRTPERRQQYKVNGFRVFDLGSHQLTLLGIGYYGSSRIPGLVPIGVTGLDDTIDPRQQDQTHMGAIAANDVWHLSSGSELHLSGFFRTYNLALLSDFGDGLIRQSEFRTGAGGQANYVKRLSEGLTIIAGFDYVREAPRRLDLDHYASANPSIYGPFEKITSNNVTIDDLSAYISASGRIVSWLRYNLGWRRDQIGFDNTDLLTPSNSFHRWAGVNSPKATVNIVAPDSLPLPSVSFSFGETFFTNDPRTGTTTQTGTPVSRAHSYQVVMSKTILGTDLRVTAGHVTQEQSPATIDPDTGLQFIQGPSRNQYVTISALRRFRLGTLQASLSKADARDLSTGAPLPEAPRFIFDVLGTVDRLPWRLKARGEFEEVGRKPLGDGFVGVPVKEFRGALVRPFLNGRLDAGIHFLLARGYTGQTTEVLALPGEGDASERIVGVRLASYAGASLTFRF
ncbi:MAG TPA: TonB-dependent receptor [Bryobacteraceae bacterium]|nr:TonB-dependent receptor [Bryobacteraceae bacterium]